jgi:Carboxypeptidase regulatory-like domain
MPEHNLPRNILEAEMMQLSKKSKQRRSSICSTTAFSIVLILCLARTSGIALAQVLYGSLVGNVADTSGAAIPGAKIVVADPSTGIIREAVTNEQGAYTVSDLQAGNYRLTITSNSFGTVVLNNVAVLNNQTRRADAQMRIAQANQTVSIEADTVAMKADRADVSSELSMQQIADLPTSTNRNFQSLFRTVPGASPPSASHAGASNPQLSLTYNINGGTNTTNSTMIDGASDEYPWLPEIAAYVPPQDAIAAVSLVTNNFDAEIGFGASSATNVTLKTGSNQLHGAVWEYNTVSALKAKNYFFIGSQNPKNIFNQFGADLGGPIWKNKLFFFGDWERTSQRNLLTGFATIPTAAEIGGNFAGTATTIYDPMTGTATGTGRTAFGSNQIAPGRISSATAKMLALLPAPNVPGVTSSNYFASGTYALTRQNADIKISYLPGGKTTFFGSYSISPSDIFDGQELGAAGGPTVDGGQPGNATGRVQRIVLGGTRSFTSSLLLDGNFAFTRLNYQAVNTDIGSAYGSMTLGIPGTNTGANPGDTLANGIPAFDLTGFTSLGNTNSSNPFHFRDNMWVEAANVTWTHASHNVRFGGEVFHYQIADFQANPTYGVRGGFTFSGGLTTLNGGSSPNQYNSLADFELGLPTAMGEDHQYFDPSVVRQNVFGFYAQDHWQVSKTLTLTYGLRYELYPYSSSDHFGGVRYDPTSNLVYIGGLGGIPKNAGVDTGHGLFAPRLGVAYRIGEKTVVRGGFGMNPNSEFFRYNVQVYPAVISAQFSGVNSYSAAGDLRTGIPAFVGPNVGAGTLILPPTFGTYTYAANYRRGYAENANFFVERDLGAGFLFDVGYVHSHGVRIDSELNINAAAPGTGKAGQPLYDAFGNASSIYGVIPFLSSDYNALQTQVKRQVGRRGSFGANYTYSKAMDSADSGSESGLTFNYLGAISRNYALAGFDRTHNFELFGSYESPFGKGQRWLQHGVAGYLAGGWQLNSVLSRTSGTPFSVTASATSLNAPGNSQLANQLVSHVHILGGHGTNHPYFDPNAFSQVTMATFGNSGRDSVRGPGYFDLDASLFRDFPIKERVILQFRAEAFGLTNTPQFANPSANVSNATFTGGSVTNLNGYDTITSSTGERQLRFAAKVSF